MKQKAKFQSALKSVANFNIIIHMSSTILLVHVAEAIDGTSQIVLSESGDRYISNLLARSSAPIQQC